VRALETASLGDARYGSVHLCEMVLEVGPLEGFASLAQGKIERQVRLGGAARKLRQHPLRSATPISSSRLVSAKLRTAARDLQGYRQRNTAGR